jgi:hypothetical protein
MIFKQLSGAPEEIRTPDPQIRSLVYYRDTGRHSPTLNQPKPTFQLMKWGFVAPCPRHWQTGPDMVLVLPGRYPKEHLTK